MTGATNGQISNATAPFSSGGGSGNATSIQNEPISATPPTINQALLFDGTQAVWANQGTTFSFSVATFTDGQAATIQIGTGTWQAIGALSFSATYNNGPATGGTVSMSGAGNTWSPNSLTMTNTFLGPTATTQVINYPGTPDTAITFTLAATGASGSGNKTLVHTFANLVYWGVSTKSSGFTAGDVTGLANSGLQTTRNKTFTVTAGASQYIIYAYPSRYGAATFTVGGFVGGFNSPETVSVTNGSGYTENYFVYSSVQNNLGATTVTVS